MVSGKWMVLTEEGIGNVQFYAFRHQQNANNFFGGLHVSSVFYDAAHPCQTRKKNDGMPGMPWQYHILSKCLDCHSKKSPTSWRPLSHLSEVFYGMVLLGLFSALANRFPPNLLSVTNYAMQCRSRVRPLGVSCTRVMKTSSCMLSAIFGIIHCVLIYYF